jgi:phosphoribosyl 1,2-cyclic phosphate phosphodiesterase
MFGGALQKGGGLPQIKLIAVDDRIQVKEVAIDVIRMEHGSYKGGVYGYRFGNAAYLTDFKTIYPDGYEKLKGVEILVVGALRVGRVGGHLNFTEALDEVEKIRPKQVWFTHICHDTCHAEIEALVEMERGKRPGLEGIEIHPGVDGQTITGIVV